MCDLSEIEVPELNQGTSFRDVLEGRRDLIRDMFYGVYCGGTKPEIRCVKKKDSGN